MTKALELTNEVDRSTLLSAVGNVVLQEDQFKQCLKIISQSGALAATRSLANGYVEQAIVALHKDKNPRWPQRLVEFLHTLTLYSVQRQA